MSLHPFLQPAADQGIAAADAVAATAASNLTTADQKLAAPGTLFVIPFYNVGTTPALPTLPTGMLNANGELVDPRGLNRNLLVWALKYQYTTAAGAASTVTLTGTAIGNTPNPKPLYTANNTILTAILNAAFYAGADSVSPLKTTNSPAKLLLSCGSGIIDAYAVVCWVTPK